MMANAVSDEDSNHRNEGDRDCDRSNTPAPGDRQGEDLGQGQSKPEPGGPRIRCLRDGLFHQKPNAGRQQGQARSCDLDHVCQEGGGQAHGRLGQTDGHG